MGVSGSGHLRIGALLVATFSVWLLPATANAYTDEQEQACSGDAMRLCSSEIPDIDRITACMIRNKAQLSPPCRAQFEPDRDPPATAAHPGKPVDIKPPRKSYRSKRPTKSNAT